MGGEGIRRAGGGRALGVAVLTFVLIEALSASVYLLQLLLTGIGPDLHQSRVTGAIMLVDTGCDLPVLILLLASERWPAAFRWTILAMAVIADAALQSVLDGRIIVATAIRVMIAGQSWRDPAIGVFATNLFGDAMWVTILALQAAYLSLRAEKRDLVASRARERSTQLSALRLQLNPHFLFNALNALSSLVVLKRTAQAETMIEALAGYLRATLAAPTAATVPLAAEIEMLEAYLQIEQTRFPERLVVDIEVDPAAAAVDLPAFLLQPLVENAVKYGVARSREPVTVAIRAAIEDGSLVVTVADDARPAAHEGYAAVSTGVGLANVRERLRLHYGAAAALTAGPRDGGGYAARVCLSP